MKNIKTAIISVVIGLLIGAIISLTIYFSMQNNYKELENLYTAANDTLVITRNDLNQEVAKTSVLEARNEKTILELQIKDKDIIHLQNVIRNEKSINKQLEQAIILKNGIIATYQDSLHNTISGYQSIIDSLGNVVQYPIYNRNIDMFDDWITGYIKLGYSVFDINIKTKSEYEIVIGRERKNIFSRYKSYAQVTNLNPYDYTETIRVYSKSEPKKDRFNISIFVGYGAGVHKSTVILTPLLGIGVGYRLISF